MGWVQYTRRLDNFDFGRVVSIYIYKSSLYNILLIQHGFIITCVGFIPCAVFCVLFKILYSFKISRTIIIAYILINTLYNIHHYSSLYERGTT